MICQAAVFLLNAVHYNLPGSRFPRLSPIPSACFIMILPGFRFPPTVQPIMIRPDRYIAIYYQWYVFACRVYIYIYHHIIYIYIYIYRERFDQSLGGTAAYFVAVWRDGLWQQLAKGGIYDANVAGNDSFRMEAVGMECLISRIWSYLEG